MCIRDRQVRGLGESQQRKGENSKTVSAVSYTHLDVYKRQQLLQQQLDDLVVVRARGEIEQDKFLQRTIEIQQQMEALRQSLSLIHI